VSRSSRVGAAKAAVERARTKRVVKETIVAVDDASILRRKTGGLYLLPGISFYSRPAVGCLSSATLVSAEYIQHIDY
jgi:hypothetical protein